MLKLAIDLGTAVTKIYRIGSGIVLAEPTCVTVSKEAGAEIRAYGADAKRLLGKTAELSEVVFPVYEGEIVNEQLAGALLAHFLTKACPRKFGGVEAIFCVPTGCTEASRQKYYRVARAAGIARIGFVEAHYLAALGQDVPLSESNPVFTVDIGAGKTSLAVFSLDSTIAGLSMCVGGNNMDIHIIDHIADLYNLKLGSLTSERLKNTVGSLTPGDNQSMIVNGRDITTGKPRAVAVASEDVLFPIRVYVDKIVEYAELMLAKLPAEVSAAMCKNGILLSGGVCALAGLSDYISDKLQMEAHLASDVHTAVVLGGGRVIGNGALMRKLSME